MVDTGVFVETSINYLVKTRDLCHDINSQVQEVRDKYALLARRQEKMGFINSCLDSQQNYLVEVILKRSIGHDFLKTNWNNNILNGIILELQEWKGKLSDRLLKLNEIKHIILPKGKTLGDFVSAEGVTLLVNRLNNVQGIKKHIDTIERQYFSLLSKVNETQNTQIHEIDHETLEKQVEKLAILELQVVDYLSSVTMHYDQCELLKKKFEHDNDYEELLKVVQNDHEDLEQIYTSLLDTQDVINGLLKQLNDDLQVELKKQDSCVASLKMQVNEFRRHQECLVIFDDVSSLIENFMETCKKDIATCKQLYSFYSDFEHAYQNLIIEVNRRKKLASKMEQILQRTEQELVALDKEDQKQRMEFLNQNGDFLPENIWPGGIDDFKPLYGLNFTVKDV